MFLVASMWDDGLVSDLKLIEILNKVGTTTTFAISPSKHKKSRSVNDLRGNYGTSVNFRELKEFSNFEICNHTDNHMDLGKLSAEDTEREIVIGRKKLEDIFQKDINGFCYPYGVYTPTAIKILLRTSVLYARTTKFINQRNNLLLYPTCRWNEINISNLEKINDNLIFWGHTYELQSVFDWNKITDIYKYITQCLDIKVVSFQEWVQNETSRRVGLHRSHKKQKLV